MFNATEFECLFHDWQSKFVQELAGLSQSVTIMQQVMFLILSMLVALVLFYLLFDRLLRFMKLSLFWGIWFYGLYNLLQIKTIKDIVLWIINAVPTDVYKHSVAPVDKGIN